MTTAVGSRASANAASSRNATPQVAYVFVVFGISGDLAKVMTCHSLYRLEERGLLNCPVVGVAANNWSTEDLRQHTRAAIEGCGQQIDEQVFDRLAARLSYLSGDFGDPATYQRLASAIGYASCPVFYLEIPPFLFGRVIKGLSEAGLTKTWDAWSSRSRSDTISTLRARSPMRSTSTSTSHSSIGSTTSSGRWDSARSSTCGSPTRCSSRSGTATTSRRLRSTMGESFGVDDRGHFYYRVGALRDVVVNRLMRPTSPRRPWSRRRRTRATD